MIAHSTNLCIKRVCGARGLGFRIKVVGLYKGSFEPATTYTVVGLKAIKKKGGSTGFR